MDDAHTETVRARGHENVRGEHESTFEVTSDDWLTPAGDCILAVDADRTPADFSAEFVAACRDRNTTITARLEVAPVGSNGEAEPLVETITGRGDPELTFESDRSLVGRTSDYVDDRTVLVEADSAAVDVDRELVAALAEGADVTLTLTVE
ncbi:hypothetical protein AArcSl_0267 [Halalkaliarchaeum desulfuricum]|uniref:DUF371 domain-containing protein n=1 Tax=Halalkaliarchaeum desulfuricum TaxID=2055893 RepID=A0A343TFQ0_9EURY|nr:DUF371 domain-containing protein [Halalkaliarchaeum desulfuricum]AUX07922.1 hypothetical protein AArcSl_0267 [Halalkaliarchaeum desulfuricum]